MAKLAATALCCVALYCDSTKQQHGLHSVCESDASSHPLADSSLFLMLVGVIAAYFCEVTDKHHPLL